MDIELRRSHFVIAGIFVLAVGSLLTWHFAKPKPTPWLDYPTDGQTEVTQFMNLIQQDSKNAHNKAYKLVTMSDRLPGDERHLQVYHEINLYLAPIFGQDWASHMTISTVTPEKNYEVRIASDACAETLHVDLEPQGPPDGPPTDHLGIFAIREFPLTEGAGATQMEGITAIVGAAGGDAARENLSGVLAAAGNFSRKTPMQIKRILLPVARNPNNQDIRRVLLQLWRVRQDPVVIAQLRSIKDDLRYPADARKTAEQVLDGTVDETELVAAGVE